MAESRRYRDIRGDAPQAPPPPVPSESDDPRVQAVIAALRDLSKSLGRTVSVADYIQHRQDNAPELPSVTTVYRLCRSWGELMAMAGLDVEEEPVKRTSQDDLVAALKKAAEDLKVDVLSSRTYDDYRLRSGEQLPSSSVIRKWLGSWEQAVIKAGLSAPQRAQVVRLQPAEAITAVQRACRLLGTREPEISDYDRAVREFPDEDLPSVQQILAVFPSWEAVVGAAEIDTSDEIHPQELWTVEEARRIVRRVERIVRKPLTEETYEAVRARAAQPMPSWKAAQELLSLDGPRRFS